MALTNAVTAYQVAAWMLNNGLAEPALLDEPIGAHAELRGEQRVIQ